jgi:hypothetical protein
MAVLLMRLLSPLVKKLARYRVDGVTVGVGLPTSHREIKMPGGVRDTETTPTGLLRGDQSRASAHESVEYCPATFSHIAKDIGDQWHRL